MRDKIRELEDRLQNIYPGIEEDSDLLARYEEIKDRIEGICSTLDELQTELIDIEGMIDLLEEDVELEQEEVL